MEHRFGRTVGFVTGMTLAAFAQAASPDQDFIDKAAKGGMAEVELSQVAQSKAQAAAVKEFAGKMVADHTKANDELKGVATKKGATVPATLDPEHKAAADKLKAASGADFDRAYMAQMVDDHKKTVALFEKEASGGKDPDVKAFAAKTLPTLREHMKHAESTTAGKAK